jgi:hypothetical protein
MVARGADYIRQRRQRSYFGARTAPRRRLARWDPSRKIPLVAASAGMVGAGDRDYSACRKVSWDRRRAAPHSATQWTDVVLARACRRGLVASRGQAPARTAAQVLVLPAAMIPAFALAKCAYGGEELAHDAPGASAAFQKSLGCFVLAHAVLHAKATEGLIRILTANTSGGLIAR